MCHPSSPRSLSKSRRSHSPDSCTSSGTASIAAMPARRQKSPSGAAMRALLVLAASRADEGVDWNRRRVVRVFDSTQMSLRGGVAMTDRRGRPYRCALSAADAHRKPQFTEEEQRPADKALRDARAAQRELESGGAEMNKLPVWIDFVDKAITSMESKGSCSMCGHACDRGAIEHAKKRKCVCSPSIGSTCENSAREMRPLRLRS